MGGVSCLIGHVDQRRHLVFIERLSIQQAAGRFEELRCAVGICCIGGRRRAGNQEIPMLFIDHFGRDKTGRLLNLRYLVGGHTNKCRA